MATLWVMILVVYSSDDGNQYNVGVSAANANPGGFAGSPPGSQTDYPRGWKMRHVYGTNVSGTGRHKLPCSTVGNSFFTSGGQFNVGYLTGNQTFNTEGRIGEKRTTKL